MDPIESWVDRDELRRLSEALLSSPPAVQAPPSDAVYGEEFEGFAASVGAASGAGGPGAEPEAAHAAPVPEAAAQAEQHARRALAAARDIARRGGLLAGPHHSAGSAPPPAEPDPQVTTPFVARLQAFGNWLRQGIAAKSFFVMDRDGGILIDEVHSPKLQQVARTLAQASRTANRQAGAAAIGNLHVKVAPDAVLEVIPVKTRYGPLILGVLVERPISPHHVEPVARALQQVVDATRES